MADDDVCIHREIVSDDDGPVIGGVRKFQDGPDDFLVGRPPWRIVESGLSRPVSGTLRRKIEII
jgi:hypothetical protein